MRHPSSFMSASLLVAWVTLSLELCGDPSRALEPVPQAKEIVPRECLVIKSVGQHRRSPLHVDAIEAQMVAGAWKAPKIADEVLLPDGSTRSWELARAGEDGWFNHTALAGGYAYFSVPADAERVVLLEAAGHGMVYVNGEPRAGDPYQTGYVRLPVLLRQGTTDLLFHVARGKLKAKLLAPRARAMLDRSDATLPDLIAGEEVQTWGAIVAINASAQAVDNLFIQATADKSVRQSLTPVPPLPPLSTRKVGFPLIGPAPVAEGTCDVELQLLRKQGERQEKLDTVRIALRVRGARQSHKRTFQSGIDGSVQYYAVNPAQPVTRKKGSAQKEKERGTRPALFFTLHGAGVEALGQVEAYSSKTWGHLVAPTNRRPFGFDWEDWGRLDALEVLDRAQQNLQTDPQRTYLTGHSMGGHGTWHIGATYPDRFAAIGPSAGWISMWSYAGAKRPDNASAMEEMLSRATTVSDTLALSPNYLQHGVYILHGGADDNVPVEQARTMKQHLSGFHRDFVYHEQAGAGHWWDASEEPGTDCVDWAPMFDFFARHSIPRRESIRQVDFVTASPGVSAWSHWVGIEAQIHPLKLSSVRMRHDPGLRRFAGSTDNVARLAVDLGHVQPGQAVHVELDGQKLSGIAWPAKTERLWLQRDGGKWSVTPPPSLATKGPHRYGPFKEAFRKHVLFVYGTQGTASENAWALAKARYDAETFWYRGNASVDVIPDGAFDVSADRDRNVIVYGNAATNAAWKVLLADSPVQVQRRQVRIGKRVATGGDLACLFLRPRPDSDKAVVGIVAGTGVAGMRLTDRLPYFMSGVAYPDCVVLGPEVLSRGSAGTRVAGFFGVDWSVSSGEFVWR